MSANVLTQRLAELEQRGLVRRRTLPPPASAQVYEATDVGARGRADRSRRSGGGRRDRRSTTRRCRSAGCRSCSSFRTMIDEKRARKVDARVGFVFGKDRYVARVRKGRIKVAQGAVEECDAVITAAPTTLAAVVYGGAPLDLLGIERRPRAGREVRRPCSCCRRRSAQGVEAVRAKSLKALAMTDIPNIVPESRADTILASPDKMVKVRDAFGIDSDMEVPAFSEADERVPDLDPAYVFDPDTTLAICAGFARNRRVMVQGYHGTGKSTHIEQVAARLNWPTIRINLDAHISRIDLVGRDAIVLQDGQQVTEFREGLLPWALQHPVALVFDEYDAGRPDVMFVIQRVLETDGKLTLLDQNRVIRPNPWFRLFATTNTIGLGDTTGLYHGTQALNQGQLDRWNIVATLNYLPAETEAQIVLAKSGEYDSKDGKEDGDQDGQGRRSVAAGLHQRRHLDGDEPAHGDQLGAECADLRRCRLRLPRELPQQVRRERARADRRILPARVRQGPARKHRQPGLNGQLAAPRPLPPCAGRARRGRSRAMPRPSDVRLRRRGRRRQDRARGVAGTVARAAAGGRGARRGRRAGAQAAPS